MDITKVSKPARYCGGEYGIADIKTDSAVKMCMCFPDVYEVGMSNLGTRLLYYMLNENPQVSCERAYAPWSDYLANMQEGQLFSSLETATPLNKFDILGFSFQYELSYSTFLYMLEHSSIPFRSSNRDESHPIIIGGGPCAVNGEPIADFVDMFIIGEAEEKLTELVNAYAEKGSMTKKQFIASCVDMEGVYVPSLGVVGSDGYVMSPIVKRQFIRDFNNSYFPHKAIVPNLEIVHDRAVVELYRGCANGCRFCQAGFIYRPVRERDSQRIYNICTDLVEFTGYDELSLNSLSTGDYSQLEKLYLPLKKYADEKKISLALPSLRLDSFEGEMADSLRKSSLTFAPEAGTQRLRDVINKNISEEDIFGSLIKAFEQGYSAVKLYFMIGLPTETMEDIEGIVNLAVAIKKLYKVHHKSAKSLRLNISSSTFIPKPFTPFQWEGFDSMENISIKQKFLKDKLKAIGVSFAWHDSQTSQIEAVFARGDRSLCAVLEEAYKLGACFDGWGEHFNYNAYIKAAEICNVDIFKMIEAKDLSKALPWDYVDIGVSKQFLATQRNLSYNATTTPSCNDKCSNCGLFKEGLCK